MQTEVDVKVESDISERKYVISSDEWMRQRMNNHHKKQVAKINLKKVKIDVPVVKVLEEVLESEGDNKGATDFPELHRITSVPQRHFSVHQISKDSDIIATDTVKVLMVIQTKIFQN